MIGEFSTGSLEAYKELVSDIHGENFSESETHDFTRCVRPNGTAYGTGGTCRKGVESDAEGIYTAAGRPKGRVPRNDPKEPLASGNTPLEKAERKLTAFRKILENPDYHPSDKELEQFGKLKLAVERFKDQSDGKLVKGFLGIGKPREDRSDLDTSEGRARGKALREAFPESSQRETFSRALKVATIVKKLDPLMRTRGVLNDEDLKKLKEVEAEIMKSKKEVTDMVLAGSKSRSSIGQRLDEIKKIKNASKGIEVVQNLLNTSRDKIAKRLVKHREAKKKETLNNSYNKSIESLEKQTTRAKRMLTGVKIQDKLNPDDAGKVRIQIKRLIEAQDKLKATLASRDASSESWGRVEALEESNKVLTVLKGKL